MPIPRFRIRTLLIAVAVAALMITLFEGNWLIVVSGVIGPAMAAHLTLDQEAPSKARSPEAKLWLRPIIGGGIAAVVAGFVYRSVRAHGPHGLMIAASALVAVLILGAAPGLLLWAVAQGAKGARPREQE